MSRRSLGRAGRSPARRNAAVRALGRGPHSAVAAGAAGVIAAAGSKSARRSRKTCRSTPKYLSVSPTHSIPLRRTVAAARVLPGLTTAMISSTSWLNAQFASARVGLAGAAVAPHVRVQLPSDLQVLLARRQPQQDRSTQPSSRPSSRRSMAQRPARRTTAGSLPASSRASFRWRPSTSRISWTSSSTKACSSCADDLRRGMSRGTNYGPQEDTRDTTGDLKAVVGPSKALGIAWLTGLRRRERRFESCRGHHA